jgi:hypothetical protein
MIILIIIILILHFLWQFRRKMDAQTTGDITKFTVAKENLSQWILLCDGPQDAELSLKLAHNLCHSQLMLLQHFLPAAVQSYIIKLTLKKVYANITMVQINQHF